MGNGLSLNLMPSDISHFYGLDQSARMVANAKIKFKNVETITGSALATPYSNGCMDLVLCIGVSEYIADGIALIREIFRVLNDSGFAIITSSPPNKLNYFRKLAGHKLYLRSDTLMTQIISSGNFNILRLNHTLIQDQYLLTKTSFK
jgi:ubiquinone/menaquinone biosynthesis C-methylase UbiE